MIQPFLKWWRRRCRGMSTRNGAACRCWNVCVTPACVRGELSIPFFNALGIILSGWCFFFEKYLIAGRCAGAPLDRIANLSSCVDCCSNRPEELLPSSCACSLANRARLSFFFVLEDKGIIYLFELKWWWMKWWGWINLFALSLNLYTFCIHWPITSLVEYYCIVIGPKNTHFRTNVDHVYIAV